MFGGDAYSCLLYTSDWYDQMFYFVRAEMECYTNMLLLMQDIEDDEDWGSTIFDESEMCIRDRLGVDRLFVDESQNYKNCAKRCA